MDILQLEMNRQEQQVEYILVLLQHVQQLLKLVQVQQQLLLVNLDLY